MATEKEIDALKDMAILSEMLRESVLGKEYALKLCAQRALRSTLCARGEERAKRLYVAGKRRLRVADELHNFVGALVYHISHLERGEYVS